MEHTLALIERSHQGDKEARDTIFKENAGLIYSVAKRFLGRGVDMEDLFQIGSIGLLKAVDHFDTSFEVRFSTYAVPMIVGEIKRYLRDDGILKVSSIFIFSFGVNPSSSSSSKNVRYDEAFPSIVSSSSRCIW